MVAQTELGYPAEHRNKVPRDHAGRRPIRLRDPSWVGEGDPGLFERQNGDRPTRDLRSAPLKEGW